MEIQVFLDVVLWRWVIGSRRFEGLWCLRLFDCLTLNLVPSTSKEPFTQCSPERIRRLILILSVNCPEFRIKGCILDCQLLYA